MYRLEWLWVVGLCCVACGGPKTVNAPVETTCTDAFERSLAQLPESFSSPEHARVNDRLQELRAGYSEQRDVLCQTDAHRACLEAAEDALETLHATLSDPSTLGTKRQQAWAIEARFAAVSMSLACNFAEGDDRGFRRQGALAFAEERDVSSEPIWLDAYLLCQRRGADGTFEDVEACHRAELTEGDRMKVGYSADQSVYAYLFAYNDTGQFQMLFPEAEEDNRAQSGEDYFMPPKAEWFELDDVAGVTEYVTLVVSSSPILDFEAMRGQDVPLEQQQALQVATRGLIEPGLTRESKLGGQAVNVEHREGEVVSTIPVKLSNPEWIAVEFEIVHR